MMIKRGEAIKCPVRIIIRHTFFFGKEEDGLLSIMGPKLPSSFGFYGSHFIYFLFGGSSRWFIRPFLMNQIYNYISLDFVKWKVSSKNIWFEKKEYFLKN